MTNGFLKKEDAVELNGKYLKNKLSDFKQKNCLISEIKPVDDRPFIAVASSNGLLVDLHLGKSPALYIYKQTANGYKFLEKRTTPEVGTGDFRWIKLVSLIKDCKALLVQDAGYNPVSIIKTSGIKIVKMTGLIDEGLNAISCPETNHLI